MSFYIILFIFVISFSFMYSHSKDLSVRVVLKTMVFLLLFLPAAIRYDIGTDYKNYVSLYQRILSGQEIKQEIGWKILNNFVILSDLGIQWIFIISSFLIYLFLFNAPKKTFFICISIFYLYLYTFSYTGLRNAISISLFIFAYFEMIKEKHINSILCLMLACLFHGSAYLYIPVYLLMRFVKLNKKTTLIIGIVIYLLMARINFVDLIFNSSLFQDSKYFVYVLREDYNRVSSTTSGMGVFLRIFHMFLLYALCEENENNKFEFSSMSWLFIFLLISDLLSVRIYIFTRLLNCFYIAYIAMYKMVFSKRTNGIRTIAKYGCLLYTFYFNFYIPLTRNDNGIIPFTTIF